MEATLKMKAAILILATLAAVGMCSPKKHHECEVHADCNAKCNEPNSIGVCVRKPPSYPKSSR